MTLTLTMTILTISFLSTLSTMTSQTNLTTLTLTLTKKVFKIVMSGQFPALAFYHYHLIKLPLNRTKINKRQINKEKKQCEREKTLKK